MDTLLFLLILGPLAAALGCLLLRVSLARTVLVSFMAIVLAACTLSLFNAEPGFYGAAHFPLGTLISLADFALLGVIGWVGWRANHRLIMGLTAFQILALAVFELLLVDHDAAIPDKAFLVDNLSMLMVAVVSVVGSLICVYALPYMRRHEAHLHLTTSRQPRFFFYLVVFLGAMNGLVLADNLLYFYFFFEATTFCSYALIGHDGTDVARANALRALWMNCLGGAAFLLGLILAHAATGSISLARITTLVPESGTLLLGIALLALAGFTKAAQLPFQSWLLGAMVAPTPVSALLHSSTMVKAGVYLVLRLAPSMSGNLVGLAVALAGGFTFAAATTLAVAQSDAKKILAYSTISNLGLIVACAGLGTAQAVTAAALLILFHAVSKGLLFCCVGAVDQELGTRDIEAMRGLWTRMPLVALIMVLGMITLLLPPFGVLLGKWMAIEAAAANLPVVVFLAIGSALSVLIYVRWAGLAMCAPFKQAPARNALDPLTAGPLVFLAGAAVVLSFFAPQIYADLLVPMLTVSPFALMDGGFEPFHGGAGSFVLLPLFLLLALAVGTGLLLAGRMTRGRLSTPYMAGINAPDERGFTGPMGAEVAFSAGNYYLRNLLAEPRLTPVLNLTAGLFLALLIGGALV